MSRLRTKLHDIFDACTWQGKYTGEAPAKSTDALYLWGAGEAEMASHFMKLLREESSAVRRALYLFEDDNGETRLAVTERTHENYDPRNVGKLTAEFMKGDKVDDYLRRLKEERGE